MIPHVKSATQTLSTKLLSSVLPEIQSSYVASDTSLLAMLMLALADEAEAGVANRLEDIKMMQTIFEQAAAVGMSVETPEFDLLLPANLTLTALNQHHDEMTIKLIELQGELESQGELSESLEAVNTQIWRYLADTHKRHALPL